MKGSDSVGEKFRESCWLTQPFQFTALPIEVNSDIARLDYIQSVAEKMAPEALIFRAADSEPNVAMARLENPSFAESSLEDVLLADTRSFMLTDVNQVDSGYADVLQRFVVWMAETLGIRPGQIMHPSVSIFLSSPLAISCYHTDREQNVLFQLAGTKRLHVFPRLTSAPREIFEALFRSRKGIHFEYREDMESNSRQYDLDVNGALYIPRLWPHWVRNGPEISVSISLNFFTLPNFALERLYNMSDRLRVEAKRQLNLADGA